MTHLKSTDTFVHEKITDYTEKNPFTVMIDTNLLSRAKPT